MVSVDVYLQQSVTHLRYVEVDLFVLSVTVCCAGQLFACLLLAMFFLWMFSTNSQPSLLPVLWWGWHVCLMGNSLLRRPTLCLFVICHLVSVDVMPRLSASLHCYLRYVEVDPCVSWVRVCCAGQLHIPVHRQHWGLRPWVAQHLPGAAGLSAQTQDRAQPAGHQRGKGGVSVCVCTLVVAHTHYRWKLRWCQRGRGVSVCLSARLL